MFLLTMKFFVVIFSLLKGTLYSDCFYIYCIYFIIYIYINGKQYFFLVNSFSKFNNIVNIISPEGTDSPLDYLFVVAGKMHFQGRCHFSESITPPWDFDKNPPETQKQIKDTNNLFI